ncbi:MAG: PEGA domain-containing protein [Pseudomonadota bacterium]
MTSPRPGRRNIPRSLLVATALAVAPSALAEKPVVLMVPYQPIARQATPELAAQVTKALAKELATGETYTIKTLEAEAPAPVETDGGSVDMDVGKGDLTKAFKALNTAEKFMKKYRFDQAIGQYQKALETFDAAAPALEEVDAVADAYIKLGVAAFRRSKEDLAEQALAQAVVLDPERTLDPREYPPLLLRVYDDIFRKTLSKPRGTIAIEATVSGAEVFYNGKSVGATPIKLNGVPPGRHFVRVVKEGAGVWGQRIEVKSGETVEIKAELGGGAKVATGGNGLTAVAAAIGANRVDVVVADAAAGLAKAEGAQFAMFGGLRKGEASIPVHTFLVDAESGALYRLIDLDIDLDMLSLSIEAFKLGEDLSNLVQAPGTDLGAGPHTIVRGVSSEEASAGPAEVDVGPPVPDGRSSRIATGGDDGRRPLSGDTGDDGDKRSVINTGDSSGGRRRTLSDDGSAFDGETTKRPTIAELDEPDEWYENPLVWAGAGGGALLLVGGATAGVVALLLLRPPTGVTVQAEWP